MVGSGGGGGGGGEEAAAPFTAEDVVCVGWLCVCVCVCVRTRVRRVLVRWLKYQYWMKYSASPLAEHYYL